jgi:ParB family chromosome partitioning protein
VHNPHVAAQRAADPPPTIAPAPEQETEEEAAQRQAEHEQRMAEYQAEQERKEEERQAEFDRQQKQYEAEQARREKQRKARVATFERILANAPLTFTAQQLRAFLSTLVNLDPYDFAEDVAEFYAGGDENNQQTPEEVLSSTVAGLPDEQLTGFALRLVLTGHTDIPRENDFDFLAQEEIGREEAEAHRHQRGEAFRKEVHTTEEENCSLDPMGSRKRLPKFLQETFPLLHLPFTACGA